jgi:ubiquinone/menaquinone biosynthesis C-methylase UbiE
VNPLRHPSELKEYYKDSRVVGDYLRRRTTQPLGSIMHAEQVRFLDAVIAERSPRRVLEVAPGPARLTAEIARVPFGVAAEFSPGMIAAARVRVESAGRAWQFVRADAFALPVAAGSFDMAYTLRFVRHFSLADRARLYAELRRVVRPGGVLVVDAQNRAVRDAGHVDRHAVYDELYTPDSLRRELEEHGFRLLRLHGVIRHHHLQRRVNRLRAYGLERLARRLIAALERLPSDNPSTWMVLCERL